MDSDRKLEIYLAGNICKHIVDNSVGEIDKWRSHVKKRLKNVATFLVPNVSVNVDADPTHYVYSDNWAVNRCDAIFGHLTEHSIGTYIELGWAWSRGIPIILVTNNDFIRNHGFIKLRCTTFNTLDKGIDYILREMVGRE